MAFRSTPSPAGGQEPRSRWYNRGVSGPRSLRAEVSRNSERQDSKLQQDGWKTSSPMQPKINPSTEPRPSTLPSNGDESNASTSASSTNMPSRTHREGKDNTPLPETVGVDERKVKRDSIVVKVGMVGDAQIGKTSLMVKYVEGKFDTDYIETLGVNFMEKIIALKNAEVTFSIWDLGGEREFISMLPLVCNDAVVIMFMFDLSRRSTLSSVKEWYRQVRGLNKRAFAFLIGTKYDIFATLPYEEQKDITKQARKFARAMKAPLVFSSSSHAINVQKLFKLIFGKVFDIDCKVEQLRKVGEPIIEYTVV